MSSVTVLRRTPVRAPTRALLRTLLRGADSESIATVAVLGMLPTGLLVTQSGAPLKVE